MDCNSLRIEYLTKDPIRGLSFTSEAIDFNNGPIFEVIDFGRLFFHNGWDRQQILQEDSLILEGREDLVLGKVPKLFTEGKKHPLIRFYMGNPFKETGILIGTINNTLIKKDFTRLGSSFDCNFNKSAIFLLWFLGILDSRVSEENIKKLILG